MTTAVTREMRVAEYAPDKLSATQTVIRAGSYLLIGGILALASWFVLHSLTLPAFNTSMMTRSLAAAASLIMVVLATWGCLLWVRDHRNLLIESVVSLAPAGIVVTSIGIPLAATRLWLDGIQVDQGFRSQFLTRMAQAPSYADMNYVDLPTFYPLGWFWLGGRMAGILNMPGWEVYQPWALTSLAAAAAMLTPVWRRITGSLPVAAAISMITVAVVLTEVPEEPYAAIVAMFFPAAAIAAQRALEGSWFATWALAGYLGISATFYTLFTAIMALTVVVMAIVAYFWTGRSFTPIKHMLIVGFSAVAVALIAWAPYLLKRISGQFDAQSTANHFLPIEGTYFPMPFFSASIIGVLSLIGLVFIILRVSDAEVAALSLALLMCYVWAMGSMAVTLLGTSLLGFRVEVLVILIFATAGVLGIADAQLTGIDLLYPGRFSDHSHRGILAAFIIVVGAGSLYYVQQIPAENQNYIDQAYADTDGYGERADRFPPDAARYYDDIVSYLSDHGRKPGEAVIYTDEINFMAYHPYYGFNAFTSHYANPLGEFDNRNAELVQWARLSQTEPEKLTAAIDASAWRAPEAFIFRGDLEAETPLKTHVAHDIYPSQPNVRYEGLFFASEAFPAAEWDMEQIGPFVVVVRK